MGLIHAQTYRLSCFPNSLHVSFTFLSVQLPVDIIAHDVQSISWRMVRSFLFCTNNVSEIFLLTFSHFAQLTPVKSQMIHMRSLYLIHFLIPKILSLNL